MSSGIWENPLAEGAEAMRVPSPCIMIIFGATGDLTARKLLPALYNLAREGQLPPHFACIGFARRDWDHEFFRQEMQKAVTQFSRTKFSDDAFWETFQKQLFYHRSEFHQDNGYESLKTFLKELDRQYDTKGNRVFYLATPSSDFPVIIEQLHKHQLIYPVNDSRGPWSRVIIEKPFGEDLTSAFTLQQHIGQYLAEEQIYRIDHYLGKETVQNLMVFRFSNPLFESVWNNRYIDHVQITVSEELGIGSRGRLWEEAGMLRDIVQNHMMQLLSIVAMDPPGNLSSHAIHDEKVKVLESIRQILSDDMEASAVRGQYGPGFINGTAVCGYRQEANVSPTSSVETYTALELYIDNWRWSGVPFYLRAGKRLPKRVTEIALIFKPVPSGYLFQLKGNPIEPNVLVIRIQPNEGISVKMNCKVPGLTGSVQPVKMDFRYGSSFGIPPPEAYERLLCDCMVGDSTLFARFDEVSASWRLLTPVLQYWSANTPEFPNYEAGTWGPRTADEMLLRNQRRWRLI